MKALLVLIALAAPALAAPLHMGNIFVDERTRGRGPAFLFTPSTPTRKQSALDRNSTYELEKRVSQTTGLERIAALDALTASLDHMDVDLNDPAAIDRAFVSLAMYYMRLVDEPELEKYPHADEILIRAAKSLGFAHESIARSAAERVIAKYPRSPFVSDARFVIATIADYQNKHATAKYQLDAVIAVEKRPEFLRYALVRRGYAQSQLLNFAAAADDMRRVASDPDAALLHEHAIGWGMSSFAAVSRPDVMAILFDSVDRSRAPEWLRDLASHYGAAGKRRDQIAALRLAMTRDGDRDETCRDRVEIASALADTKNAIELELAVAAVVEALLFADRTCALAADQVVGEIAFARHTKLTRKTKRHVKQLWTHAAELATSSERRELAIKKLDSLR